MHNVTTDAASPRVDAQQFRRALRLQDLILFGIICVTPIAPILPFGILEKLSNGFAVTTLLIAMFAMLPTAFSYGRMAAEYPSAGSAYTYVAKALHPNLGFVAGWACSLDYLLIPAINVIYCAVTMHRVVPTVPYIVWAGGFAGLSTILNLRGLRTGVTANQVLFAIMAAVLCAVVVLAVKYIVSTDGMHALLSAAPLYEPGRFRLSAIATGTSFAILNYIGFDAVTTLAEEARSPRRDVGRAIVIVCLITGVGSAVIVYLAQLVWPDFHQFSNFDTAFLDVAQRIGGKALFIAMVAVLIIGAFGATFTGQAGAARLLFGMGRAGALPRRFFSHLNAVTLQPSRNLLLTGSISLGAASLLSFEQAGELLNFGAYLAFLGVNVSALRSALKARKRGENVAFVWVALPAFGALSCFAIWVSLPATAWFMGLAWLAVGLAYQLILTRGWRLPSEFPSKGTP